MEYIIIGLLLGVCVINRFTMADLRKEISSLKRQEKPALHPDIVAAAHARKARIAVPN